MRELAAAGCDVGYHYEELATLIRERGAASAAQARALIPEARERLRAALAELRAGSGLPLDLLASHGDFANRAVDVANVELLDDPGFRAELGVRLEAYDIAGDVDARATDAGGAWWPEDPAAALARGEPVRRGARASARVGRGAARQRPARRRAAGRGGPVRGGAPLTRHGVERELEVAGAEVAPAPLVPADPVAVLGELGVAAVEHGAGVEAELRALADRERLVGRWRRRARDEREAVADRHPRGNRTWTQPGRS